MADKFSSLVDNLSEIYSKKCKDENCKSECDFIGYKNNKFVTNVKNVKKKMVKPSKQINQKVSECLSTFQW